MKRCIDATADPECQTLLADLRAMAARAEALSTRFDREHVAVGTLWGVTRGLREAVASAEAEMVPAAQPDCQHEWHDYGTVNGVRDVGCQMCGATKAQ